MRPAAGWILVFREPARVHPGAGPRQQATIVGSLKPQATSVKQQASSAKLGKIQATSFKRRAAGFKLQASSDKQLDIFSFIKFRETRSE